MPAAEELERICERIECDNPEAARRVARAIYDGCARLKELSVPWTPQQPHCRPAGTGVSPLPYIAVYQVTENAVEISHIFHGAQDWP
jgi:plasmid stabilization system protein ParE